MLFSFIQFSIAITQIFFRLHWAKLFSFYFFYVQNVLNGLFVYKTISQIQTIK